jgi:hypothetical protein
LTFAAASSSLTTQEQRELFQMVKELYHHLGLDGERPQSINHLREEAKKDVLKWQERQAKKKHERETS